jgi:hypothetical protein
MIVKFKCLDDKMKWKPMPLDEKIVSHSLARLMADSEKTIIAAVYNEEGQKPIAFITNTEKYYEDYKDTACTIMAQDLCILMGEQPQAEVVVEIFKDAGVIKTMTLEEKEDLPKEKD